MTPFKAILFCGMVVMTLDYANMAEIVCVAANEYQRNWIVDSLRVFHGVESKEVPELPTLRYSDPA